MKNRKERLFVVTMTGWVQSYQACQSICCPHCERNFLVSNGMDGVDVADETVSTGLLLSDVLKRLDRKRVRVHIQELEP